MIFYINRYFIMIYAFVLLVTSVLLIPSIQGTTAAYLLSFLGIPLMFFIHRYRRRWFIRDVLILFSVYTILVVFSQFSLMISPHLDFSGLRLVGHSNSYLLRKTIFTQSLYLFAGFCCFLIMKHFYKQRHEKYFFYGAIFLAIYGLYEFIYFLIFHDNGDFLTNRFFDGEVASQFQTMTVSGFSFERLKSLTGEASMYSFTILPFWIFAMHTKRLKTAILLFVTLLLTASTTALLGMFIYALMNLKGIIGFIIKYKRSTSIIVLFIAVTVSIKYSYFYKLIDSMVIDKLTMSNASGSSRVTYFLNQMGFFVHDMPFLNKLFGIGFGTVRSTDFLSTLLVNCGIVGFLLFTLLFLYPVIKLDISDLKERGLIIANVVIYITMMVSVPEFAYLSTWFILGTSYKIVDSQKEFSSSNKKGY